MTQNDIFWGPQKRAKIIAEADFLGVPIDPIPSTPEKRIFAKNGECLEQKAYLFEGGGPAPPWGVPLLGPQKIKIIIFTSSQKKPPGVPF